MQGNILKNREIFLLYAFIALFLPLFYHFYAIKSGLPFLLNLDDGYIHLKLAENFVKTGHLGLYPGEGGGGSSSLVWTMLLSFLILIGIPGDIGALASSLTCWIVTVLIFARFTHHLYGSTIKSAVTVLIVIISGQLTAIALSGMETHLFLLFITLSLFAYMKQQRITSLTWIGLASLTRPEAVFLAAAIFLYEVLFRVKQVAETQLNSQSRQSSYISRFIKSAAFPVVSLSALFIGWVVLYLLAGNTPDTFAARRWLIGMPQSLLDDPAMIYIGAWKLITLMSDRLTSYIGPGYGIGVFWAIIITGLFFSGLVSSWRKKSDIIDTRQTILVNGILGIIGIYIILHLLFHLLLLPTPGHLGRYLAPIWLFSPLLIVSGWESLQALLKKFRTSRIAPYLAAFLIISYVPQLVKWCGWHRDTIHHLANVHLKMAEYVRETIPVDEPVAIFDIGIAGWKIPHRIIDLGGLTGKEYLDALHDRNVPWLLMNNNVKYIVLPEFDGVQRWIVGSRLNLFPKDLVEIYRVTLGEKHFPHIPPTLVALPASGLYTWKKADED